METQNTELKPSGENLVYVDEVDLFDPAEDEAARLREELKEERERHLRLAAEFENFRRRTKREQAEASEKGKRELLERLISLADDFDLALANLQSGSNESVVEGLRMIERRLSSVLETNGVIPFESAGEIFNPEIHEAFDVVTVAEGASAGRVHSQIRRGYFWNGKLLRPALVVVAQ